MQQRRGLGRGLESLISSPVSTIETKPKGVQTVSIDLITPNRLQP